MLSAQMLQIRLTKQPEAPLYLTTRPSAISMCRL